MIWGYHYFWKHPNHAHLSFWHLEFLETFLALWIASSCDINLYVIGREMTMTMTIIIIIIIIIIIKQLGQNWSKTLPETNIFAHENPTIFDGISQDFHGDFHGLCPVVSWTPRALKSHVELLDAGYIYISTPEDERRKNLKKLPHVEKENHLNQTIMTSGSIR